MCLRMDALSVDGCGWNINGPGAAAPGPFCFRSACVPGRAMCGLFFYCKCGNDHIFFIQIVWIVYGDTEFAYRFLGQGYQVRFLAVFFCRETEAFQFIGFHTAESTYGGEFCQSAFAGRFETEYIDSGYGVGFVVHRFDDETYAIALFQPDLGFGRLDDEFGLGLSYADYQCSGIGTGS